MIMQLFISKKKMYDDYYCVVSNYIQATNISRDYVTLIVKGDCSTDGNNNISDDNDQDGCS